MGLVKRFKEKFRRESSDQNNGGQVSKDLSCEEESSSLQDQLDSLRDGETLQLIPREFCGPVVLKHPLVLEGQGATIWSHTGPVISIESDGVVLRSLRIEVTGETEKATLEDDCALRVQAGKGVLLEDVEVRGTVIGLPDEEGEWRYPHSLQIENLSHGAEHEFKMRIVVPVSSTVTSNIHGLEVEPRNLGAGPNEILMRVGRLPQDTLLHGHLSISTKFLKRRITFTAHILSVQNGEPTSSMTSQVIWEPKDWSTFAITPEQQPEPPEAVSVHSTPGEHSLDMQPSEVSMQQPDSAQVELAVPPRYPEPSADSVQETQVTVSRGESVDTDSEIPPPSEPQDELQGAQPPSQEVRKQRSPKPPDKEARGEHPEPQRDTEQAKPSLREKPSVRTDSTTELDSQEPTESISPDSSIRSDKPSPSGLRRMDGSQVSSVFSKPYETDESKAKENGPDTNGRGEYKITREKASQQVPKFLETPKHGADNSLSDKVRTKENSDAPEAPSATLRSRRTKSKPISGVFEEVPIQDDASREMDELASAQDDEEALSQEPSKKKKKKPVRRPLISPLFGGKTDEDSESQDE